MTANGIICVTSCATSQSQVYFSNGSSMCIASSIVPFSMNLVTMVDSVGNTISIYMSI
jgi:hypothetical protein